jgi:hypothetical protein
MTKTRGNEGTKQTLLYYTYTIPKGKKRETSVVGKREEKEGSSLARLRIGEGWSARGTWNGIVVLVSCSIDNCTRTPRPHGHMAATGL